MYKATLGALGHKNDAIKNGTQNQHNTGLISFCCQANFKHKKGDRRKPFFYNFLSRIGETINSSKKKRPWKLFFADKLIKNDTQNQRYTGLINFKTKTVGDFREHSVLGFK